MEQEFEEQISSWGKQNMEDEQREGSSSSQCDQPLDDHAKTIQRRMFAKTLEMQQQDYAKFFLHAGTEFHVKVAGLLTDLSHAGRVMLDAAQGSVPVQEVEDRWMEALVARNRRGALAHTC